MFSPRAIRSISSLNHLFYSIPSPALGNRYPPPHPYLPQLQACRPIEHMLLSHTTYVAPELAPKHIADNIMKCSPKQSKPAATSGSPVRFQRTPKNTKAILKEAGSGLDRVVKVVVSTL
ncbi:hypothetical protein AFLA70_99g002621 [Aspergillus flavus AF70]|nr:hypothetical protein AFLA70_99g002621 [Aspergillus flavus AF70]